MNDFKGESQLFSHTKISHLANIRVPNINCSLRSARILLLFHLSEGVYAEALEIPLLSSFSSPVRVLNKIYPET